MKITLVPPELTQARWKEWREARRLTPPQDRRAKNLSPVLELGDVAYFLFRGRAYGVPPLPWLEGEKILDSWLEAQSYGDGINQETLQPYFNCIRRLANLIWANVFPTGKIRKQLKKWHLLRNPFLKATEAEVAERALFLLERRTSTSGPLVMARMMGAYRQDHGT